MIDSRVLVNAQYELGEGIQWNARLERLFWTDLQGRALWSCDAYGDNIDQVKTEERLCSFCFDPEDNVLAAFESGLFRWNPQTGKQDRLTRFEPEHEGSRYNDGRCDRDGNFIAGGIDEGRFKPTSSVTRYANNTVSTVLRDITCANSICFSPDGKKMYFADSPTGVINRFDYDALTGELSSPEVFHKGKGNSGDPDGSCIDARGYLWNARYGGSRVVCVDPIGNVVEEVEVDAPLVTCACFGGSDLDKLYITTGRQHMSADDIAASPLSGSVFVCNPGVHGLQEDRFGHVLF